MDDIQDKIKDCTILMISVPGCKDCKSLQKFFFDINLQNKFDVFNLKDVEDEEYDKVVQYLEGITKTRVCPMVFIKGEYYGSYNDIIKMYDFGTLKDLLIEKLNIVIEEVYF